MNQLTKQQYADLAKDAYEIRQVTGRGHPIPIGENQYRVLAVHNNPKNGYQGTVYQDVRTNEIIVAHRGTEELLDGLNDAAMVTSKYTAQSKDAIELTKKALDKLNEFHAQNPKQPKPRITHTGHSLGGALAQIAAHYFDHEGVTYNAFGAASLGRIPEGGNRVINYVKATDPVAAASPHYGKVVVLYKAATSFAQKNASFCTN